MAVFLPTRWTGNDYSPKGGLICAACSPLSTLSGVELKAHVKFKKCPSRRVDSSSLNSNLIRHDVGTFLEDYFKYQNAHKK